MRRRWRVWYDPFPPPNDAEPNPERCSILMYFRDAVSYLRIFPDANRIESTYGLTIRRRFVWGKLK
jgi:hypothetical protein